MLVHQRVMFDCHIAIVSLLRRSTGRRSPRLVQASQRRAEKIPVIHPIRPGFREVGNKGS